MPQAGHTLPSPAMRDHAMAVLGELTNGRFGERMRQDWAARMLVAVHRVLSLRDAGLMREARPRPAQRRAVLEVERIARNWLPVATTAHEYVGDLQPADVLLLLELAPSWAAVARAAG